MRKIPLKNYIIYMVVVIVTVAISFYIVALFNQNKEYYENNSILKDILSEIIIKKDLTINENFDNYLLEKSDLIVYISSGKNKNIKSFENEFKKYVIEHKLEDDIVYINLDNTNKDFVTDFLHIFSSNEELKNYQINIKQPIFIVFKDGKIRNVYNEKDGSIYKVNLFFIETGVVVND